MIEILRHKGFQKRSLFLLFFLTVSLQGKSGFALPVNEDSARSFMNMPSAFMYAPDSTIRVDVTKIKAGLLYDVNSKKIVWQSQMNNIYPVASLTKMMLALLAVEDIHAGKVSWDDQVRWTRDVYYWVKRRKVRSIADVTYSVRDLFKNAMIASNNEASEQLARYLGGGNLDGFIQRMNLRARELGMNSTYYGNPTGLPSSSRLYDNSSTPADLLILAIEMLNYEEIIQVTRMDYADINNGKSTSIIRNHNGLTVDYKGEVDGMKTGYTRRAGFCLVASSYKCDHRLISVVLGAKAPGTRNDIVRDMINDYYTTLGIGKLSPSCNMPEQFAEAGSTNNEDASSPEGTYVYQTKRSFVTHVVRKGEFLASIAKKYDCSLSQLKSWNRLKSSRIMPGQKLMVRKMVREKVWVTRDDVAQNQNTPDSKPAVKQAVSVREPEETNSEFIYYTINPGDTLFSISRQYQGASVEKLKELNNITDEEALKPGMKIKVPKG